MGKAKDLTGQRFGRLTALEPTEERYRRDVIWRCKCDCGNVTFVPTSLLKSNRTKSCGRLRSENSAQLFKNVQHLGSKKNIKHNSINTRLYGVWITMKKRCYNPKHNRYKDYGGRGITVCDDWLHDFQAFHDWAMANGYDENAPRGKCTLDRIDVDGNYCPENCRWVDMKTQANNRRNNKNNKKEI